MSDNGPEDFNQAIIEEFRANEGRVGGGFEGVPLLLLTMTGAKSGRRRTTPLTYFEEGGDRYVFGTFGGNPQHPAWFHNIVAHPAVEVEAGTERYDAEAEVVPAEERDRIWEAQRARMPAFRDYEKRTEGRQIPVIRLRRRG